MTALQQHERHPVGRLHTAEASRTSPVLELRARRSSANGSASPDMSRKSQKTRCKTHVPTYRYKYCINTYAHTHSRRTCMNLRSRNSDTARRGSWFAVGLQAAYLSQVQVHSKTQVQATKCPNSDMPKLGFLSFEECSYTPCQLKGSTTSNEFDHAYLYTCIYVNIRAYIQTSILAYKQAYVFYPNKVMYIHMRYSNA